VPRGDHGAVIDDVGVAADRALEIAADQSITTIDGTRVNVVADSLCVHGDSANALQIVRAARNKLEANGFTIAAFTR
jgi:Uncharacterized proteins, homologs of lactam utilization protein B